MYRIFVSSSSLLLMIALFAVHGLENDFGQSETVADEAKNLVKRKIPDAKWNPWSAWGPCSKQCQGGVQVRTRTCRTYGPGQSCQGPAKEEKACNQHACPGKWTGWSQWTKCSRSCGGGDQSRNRTCVSSVNETAPSSNCKGPNRETQKCNSHSCPVQQLLQKPPVGKWSDWSDWSTCSKTCGLSSGGEQWRDRKCLNGGKEGVSAGCLGPAREKRPCNRQACPQPKPTTTKRQQPGVWSGWSWSGACSTTCGKGMRKRVRTCIGGGNGGCKGPTEEMVPCTNKPCKV